MSGAEAARTLVRRDIMDAPCADAEPPGSVRERHARAAIFDLVLRTPYWSAARRVTPGQKRVLTGGAAFAGVAAAVSPTGFLWFVTALAMAGFGTLIGFRVWAACTARALPPPTPQPDDELPVYTIIAPLYREARVAGALISALRAIDYPRDRLDVLLVAEADDRETLAALESHAPPEMRIVRVPNIGPRTKPKALTYALTLAKGAFVTIYDAEDRPDPQQLRAAVGAFRAGGPDMVCVQAPLTYYNARENFFTRCFQLEYAVHFRILLPALVRLGAPAPLGGTSNHFRAPALRAAGGWDPFNVTEDADLGFRLAALGGRIGMIAPPTWEEATCALWPWIRQRSRWLKGYAQTILVHMRRTPHPAGARRRLRGAAKATSLWLTLGGPLAAAMLHGPALIWLLYAAVRGAITEAPGPSSIALIMLGAGYASSALAAVVAARLTKDGSLLLAMLLTPFYWPLQSIAAFLAIRQLIVAPFRWEKTEHGVTRLGDRPIPGTGDGARAPAGIGKKAQAGSPADDITLRPSRPRTGGDIHAVARDAGARAKPAMHR